MDSSPFRFTVAEIAAWVDGEVRGDGEKAVAGVGSLQSAGSDQLSFVRDDVAAADATASRAGALIVHRSLETVRCAQIVAKDPSLAFVRVLERYQRLTTPRPRGISPLASIAPTARLGRDVAVGAFAAIEEGALVGDEVVIYPRVYIGQDVEIGAQTVVYPQAVIREFCTVGARCIIHCGSVIGDDGFGYIQRGGRHVKVPQVGRVVIGNDVEIGAVVTVARAALDVTRIGDGVKIDNHSHVAHNVEIGEHSMLIAYAKLAGSVRIGRGVMLAEDVGVTDHAVIGDGAVVGGGSKVYKDLKPGEVVWGCPARPANLEKRIQALITRLPDMRDKVRDLEQRLAKLEAMLAVEGGEEKAEGA